MKKTKNIDIFDLGKNTFNSCYSQLKNDKKVLRLYSQQIEDYLNSIEESKNILYNINRDIEKNSSIDKPFCFLKKFEIILNLQCNYYDFFLENSQKSFEVLKESIDKNCTTITNFLANTQTLNANIKNKSVEFFDKHNKVIASLREVELCTVDDYIINTYKIPINKDKINPNKIEDLINESYKCEKEYNKSLQNMKDIFKNFLTEYNLNMKEIKMAMTKLNDDCKSEILNIINIMKDNCNNLLNLINGASLKIENYDNNNNKFKDGYSEYLNNEIKEEELFEVLNTDKYKLNIINEEEKNISEIKSFKHKNSINKQVKNYIITGNDIYNIVKKIYDYNFETIDKEIYNLSIEKNKLEITKLASKLLGYDFYKHEKLQKTEKMSEDEIINYINFIFLKEDYIIEFLARLNNYRTIGKLELSVDLFNTIKIIFDKAADYLMIKSSDRIYNFLIILSQTFYIVKNNEKYFLQKELLHKEFFRSVEFWNNKLDKTIDEEIERLDEELAKNGVELNENKKNRKKEEILFTKFVSFIASLNGFELEKEKIDKILFPLFEKYNVKEEMKNSILSLLNVYKNNN
jgi:hypothetical protein